MCIKEMSDIASAPININPRRGGEGGSSELDNFDKSLTNSPPTGKNFVSNPLDGPLNLYNLELQETYLIDSSHVFCCSI